MNITAGDGPTMIDQAALDEVFPINPLKQVAFEVRYPFNLQVQRDLCDIQKLIKGDYPKFAIDEVEFLEGSPAKVHTFRSDDDNRSVRISEDRFAMVYTKYENFELFKAEALKRTAEFCSLFGIVRFERVGLRFVNHIEVPKEGNTYQVTKVANPYFDIKRATVSGPMRFSLELTMRMPTCLLTVRTAFAGKPPDQPHAIYLLDLDAYAQNNTSLDDLSKLSDELHGQAQREFLSHITEEYKMVMRGR